MDPFEPQTLSYQVTHRVSWHDYLQYPHGANRALLSLEHVVPTVWRILSLRHQVLQQQTQFHACLQGVYFVGRIPEYLLKKVDILGEKRRLEYQVQQFAIGRLQSGYRHLQEHNCAIPNMWISLYREKANKGVKTAFVQLSELVIPSRNFV
jgi:hypothetical protein